MKIKSILNHDLVNLTNCESEPIHIPGSIQPHGFLLAVRSEDYRIDFCSANCGDFLGLSPQMILGKSLKDIFDDVQTDRFHAYVTREHIDNAQPFVFVYNEVPYNSTIHKNSGTIIVELEEFPDGTLDLPNLYTQTRNFVSYMEGTRTIEDLCQAIAGETRAITGYDRVMIYHFDKEYNGEVIAESKREDLISFSGQKYPHTDIPVQARELYIRNMMRMISDINYTPVPLLTLDDDDNKNNRSLDLSLSILRSVSPIHIEYLKNMGVGATLTVSLIQNQKLWGLIACHHYSPKLLPHYTRLSALLQGHFLTSQISVREVAEEFVISQNTDQALHELQNELLSDQNFIENFHDSPLILQLCHASGAVILHEGKIYKNGRVPEDRDILALFGWLTANHTNNHLHTSKIFDLYPQGEHFSNFAAGIVYHSMPGDGGILWMRPEVVQNINWAGNPEKSVMINEEGLKLSPRKSFELWKEFVKNKSREWRKSEINAASSFAYALQKHINLDLVRSQEEKYRLLNDDLTAANKELANLNWISTHDLKEPLRKIQIFASKVLDREDPQLSDLVKDSVGRMRFAAEKMQHLIEDILSYSQAGNMEKVFEETDFTQIVNEVLSDMSDEIREKGAVITCETLPVLPAITFQIRQLFINLISNAIKFIKPGVVPHVEISLSKVRGTLFSQSLPGNTEYYQISVKDNGIGFEEEYNQRIFDVFQRLHPANQYPGTGIGLAICKKIAENHKGRITAFSEPGTGSVFSIFLPVR